MLRKHLIALIFGFMQINASAQKDVAIYTSVDVDGYYIGGESALQQFVVEPDGQLTSIKTMLPIESR